MTIALEGDILVARCLSLAGEPLCAAAGLTQEAKLEDVVDALKPKLGFPKA